MLVLAIGFICQACISLAFFPILRQALFADRTAEVQHLDEVAYSLCAYYYDRAQHGLMTDRQARTAAADAIRAMHYDGKNYYFVWQLDGTGIAHGAHPEWEGKRFINSPQAKQFPVISYMVSRLLAVARSPAAQGVSSYRIPKAGMKSPVEKIAYSRLFKPWGWSVGTGAYADDIETVFGNEVVSLLWLFAGLIAIASCITFLLGRDLAEALMRLSNRTASVAAGEFDGEVPAIDRRDEVGVMARALLVLRDNSREAVELRLDQLTGLPNRKLLMDRLADEIAASALNGTYGGVIFIDLDKFKSLNDTQGHDAGDMLLRQVARRLTGSVRATDTVARLGGDEFVLVLGDLGANRAEAAEAMETVAATVLTALRKPARIGNITHVGSASLGLTLFKDASAGIVNILKQADLAMYRAKEGGGSAYCFFDPLMETAVRDRVVLEADLVRAIAESEFELYYQAQSTGDGRVKGAEALIRWNHPTRGVVSPIEFIAFAEETGLILPIGRWVLEAAGAELARWQRDPLLAGLKLAVNVSPRQFGQTHFVDECLSTLRLAGADPRGLELEITESLLVTDVDELIAKMDALRAAGVSFSLDDFGTGYSSLSYLKRMPLDHLKIDRTFVQDVLTDPNDAAIAQTVVALAQTLGLGVIAEGVENAEQRDYLAGVGCTDFQGYFFSRPVPAHAFVEFVRQRPGVTPVAVS